MGNKKSSIRTKLIFTFLAVGVLPLIISSVFSFVQFSHEIEEQATERAKLVAQNKAQAIVSYFQRESQAIIDMASSQSTLAAFEEFADHFSRELPSNHSQWEQKFRQELNQYYADKFGPLYKEKSGHKIATEGIVAKLDLRSLIAQYDFIVTNDNPIGKKDLLVTPKRSSPYAQSHEKYHAFFHDYLIRHALYDLFLIAPDGRIVYSVFKETDFSTSLRQGPWAQTSIAKAFESSLKLEAGKIHIEDFAPYTPSYEDPASFASTPIFKDGKLVGILMIQLPLDKISAAAGDREGLGKQGETLLLGSDLKLRADTFRHKDTHTVVKNFAAESAVSVESEAVKKAQSGVAGFMRNVSYDGLKTKAYYAPLKIENLNWYIITELSEDELYEGLNRVIFYTLAFILVGALITAAVAYYFGNSLSRNLKAIAEVLGNSSREVFAASQQSASSATQLSEASTEQAASLQETMASIEEISAMVSQNADSAGRTQQVVQANQKVSEDGARNVDEMLQAISEIKDTNNEILAQMEESNQEFGEIVKIISDIGAKTNVINDIVFQTKLLSFNASVEAARAGEHGKGFAVVAEEVGNLAQMSGNAAKEISDMLSGSIKKVNTIVESTKTRVDRLVETGKDRIAMGQATAEKCRVALNDITGNAKSISSMVTEIAHASKEQSQGVQEINKAIGQLDQVTQQNSSVAQQSSTQSGQLNKEAQSLAAAVKDLIVFVEGIDTAHASDESKTLAPVTVLRPKKQQVSPALQKVSGEAETPSASDPQFEEF